MGFILNLDADVANADWVKRTWDLPTDPEWFIRTKGRNLAAWMAWVDTVPAGKAMPVELRAALVAHLAGMHGADAPLEKTMQAVISSLAATLDVLGEPVTEMRVSDVETKRHSFVVKTKEHPMIVEIKRLLDGFRAIEAKSTNVVRHVRTPEGVRKYGLPIGAVIVARSGKNSQLTHIWSTGIMSEDGYEKYNGANNSKHKDGKNKAAEYWVGQDGGKGKWKVYDEDGRFTGIAEDDEASVLLALEKEAASKSVGRTSRGNQPGHNPERGSREPKEGYHKPTGKELIDLGIANLDLVDIFIKDNLPPAGPDEE